MVSNEPADVSLLRGLCFRFQVSGRELVYWVSALSGMERVTLGGALVAESRSLKGTSKHELRIDEVAHTVHLKLVSLTQGQIVCWLDRRGELVTEYTMRCVKPQRSRREKLLPPVLLGAVSGAAYVGGLSVIFVVGGLVIVTAVAMLRARGRWQCEVRHGAGGA